MSSGRAAGLARMSRSGRSEKRAADGPWTRYVLRPLAFPTAGFFLALGWTPNAVTYLSIGLCALAFPLLAAAIPAAAYLEALQLRPLLLRQFVEHVYAQCDVLFTPTLVIPVPTLAETDVGGSAAMWEVIARLAASARSQSVWSVERAVAMPRQPGRNAWCVRLRAGSVASARTSARTGAHRR